MLRAALSSLPQASQPAPRPRPISTSAPHLPRSVRVTPRCQRPWPQASLPRGCTGTLCACDGHVRLKA
eukprot:449450-Rhodomonas_salina.1